MDYDLKTLNSRFQVCHAKTKTNKFSTCYQINVSQTHDGMLCLLNYLLVYFCHLPCYNTAPIQASNDKQLYEIFLTVRVLKIYSIVVPEEFTNITMKRHEINYKHSSNKRKIEYKTPEY